MKNARKKSHLTLIIIIILVILLLAVTAILILKLDVFKEKENIPVEENKEFKLAFKENSFIDVIGYDFHTKVDGSVYIKANSAYEISNISPSGVIIDTKENIVDIKIYKTEGNKVPNKVLMLSENGNIFKLDLGQDVINDSKLYKYTSEFKVKEIKQGDVGSIFYSNGSIAILDNNEIRVIGSTKILDKPEVYSLGKTYEMIGKNNYLVIENDNRIRIGNILTDKYFNVEEEKWINSDSDIGKYVYLKNEDGTVLKANNFKIISSNSNINIYILTETNKLLYVKTSEDSLKSNSRIIESYEINLNKDILDFISKENNQTIRIKFTDGTTADIKDNMLIFGLLSNKNIFFTYSKQELKGKIDYKILTNKDGINYKVKDYQTIENQVTSSGIYVINVFMITEDGKMIMTKISNSTSENYIDSGKIVDIKTEKEIDKLEKNYNQNEGYTTKIVFKDGTKIDLRNHVKEYLS